MLLRDRSHTTRIELRRVQLLVNAHAQNPSKRLQDQGVVPSSIITELKRTQPCCPCGEIKLIDIATFDSSYWKLNANTTITECQFLTIPINELFFTGKFTLINNGTINIKGILRVADTTGKLVNNNTINIYSGGESIFAFSSFCKNNGIINNSGRITVQEQADDISLTNIGTINNSGEILINVASINNAGGKIYNNGIITNSNYGTIYNNNDGLIDNTDGSYVINGGNFPGDFNNADNTLGCGIGQIIGTITPTGNLCPP